MLDSIAPGRSTAELIKGIKVIDVDTHLSEPHDMWTSRAPAKWKERVPQVRADASGKSTMFTPPVRKARRGWR